LVASEGRERFGYLIHS